MNVFSLVGIATLATSAALLVRTQRRDLAALIGVGVSALLLVYTLEPMKEVFTLMNETAEKYGVNNSYIKILIKIIGISYLVRFGADICYDSGEAGVGNKVELLGKLMLLVLCIPIITQMLDAVAGLLGI